jgi:energy-coupling factor transporter ATP-binding protein EcfA2
VALHGSAVIAPGGALIFLGHGGAGKSTICQLLAGHFPKLSDDAVYLAGQGDGEWYVTNADQRAFAGPLREGELDGREWTVLRAVVRIFQSPTTRLVPVTPLAACRHLTDAAFEIGWQKLRRDDPREVFSTVAQVARSYPGWELRFGLGPETAEMVAEVFGGKE